MFVEKSINYSTNALGPLAYSFPSSVNSLTQTDVFEQLVAWWQSICSIVFCVVG
jgi:hypothetical protein